MSAEPLATALWEARATATPIPAERWRGLSLERAESVARALYARESADGGAQIGWKLGATDAAGQRALGADGPFVAPVFSTTAIGSGGRVSLGRYIAPRLEAEVGVGWRDGEPVMVPCAEIVDCRLAGWEVDLPLVVADFALQAGMVFGPVPAGWHDAVEVVVRHEGAPVARGEREGRAVADAVALTGAGDGGGLIATGSLVGQVPLRPGAWELDFGPLGRLALSVDE